MKLYNSIIAFDRKDGTAGISITSDVKKRLQKFVMTEHKTFKIFTTENSLSKNQLIDMFINDQWFIENESYQFALKCKKQKTNNVSVQDILNVVKTEYKELV